jgi:hypothetical protein
MFLASSASSRNIIIGGVMITKDNLIDMLEKSLANEDEFIIEYGKDFLQKVKQSSELTDDEKNEIESITTALLNDTQRHSEILGGLIKKIKEDQKNEY